MRDWRAEGVPVFYTIDAGPNVHVITLKEKMFEVKEKLEKLTGVKEVLTATVGGAVRALEG